MRGRESEAYTLREIYRAKCVAEDAWTPTKMQSFDTLFVEALRAEHAAAHGGGPRSMRGGIGRYEMVAFVIGIVVGFLGRGFGL